MRRRHLSRIDGSELLVDGRADVTHVGSRRVELTRAVRDVDANRTGDPMLVPLDDVPFRITPLHEAIVASGMTRVLAPAEAGDVREHFRVLGGELVRGGHDLDRAGRRVALERNRRQTGL